MSDKAINKYKELIEHGKSIMNKYGWRANGNRGWTKTPPLNEYSNFVAKSMGLIKSTLGESNPNYTLLIGLTTDERKKRPYYFAQCLGFLEAAFDDYKEKDPNKEFVELDKKVFIVHGHKKEIKEKVARLLENQKLDVIILHEQPNKGRTIIEKFIDHASKSSFAIILMTADDLGRGEKEKELIKRARQNVILELGFFIGKLGMSNVCALYENKVEMPSDYLGVTYIALDSEDWKYKLIKELKAVGFDVDANKVK